MNSDTYKLDGLCGIGLWMENASEPLTNTDKINESSKSLIVIVTNSARNIRLFYCLSIFGVVLIFAYSLFLNSERPIELPTAPSTWRIFETNDKSNYNNNNNNVCNYGPNGPRIFCSVITHRGNLESKAMAVNKTWGIRKNVFPERIEVEWAWKWCFVMDLKVDAATN